MKMKAIFSSVSVLAALFFCCSLNQVQAQAATKGKARTNAKAGAKVDAKVDANANYCDAVLPAIEKQLQADADATCTTQTTCVDCMDRTSKMTLAATLYVQPNKAACNSASDIVANSVTDIVANTDALSRGASKQAPHRFVAKLMQSPCYAGGTNLEVVVPGYDLRKKQFSFLWEVDGKKAGHLTSVQCACGKEAKVRVTHLLTGESVNLTMKLNSTCSTNKTK
ncbi:MAG: hypothetical protein K9J37_16630 [Saprospiraceae bacterium]|nr:hypothetical protein [Saprospiraceae bacterium]MCF8251541.1 hypothetical protein [Saprospiraceae bacterium]MCF8280871.1 hypothetical protein [Bacteroidales bacterium]MCF8310949.1 hypothetical protein [Saprospiraceae bacterium]MCF8439715.1 hypothetical protein [Saprospiraceae bacterium]